MATKKMQMYRTNSDGTETNLYPLTEAQYVTMEDGQTVQEILSSRDNDKYTPTISNSSSFFKVGQGDNVDFSDNVMNGAYEDVVLKGKSLVNVIQGSSKDKVVLPYSFEEGEYGTINDTHENGRVEVEVKGRTLVNLTSPHEEKEVSFIHRWQTYALTNDIIPTGLIEGELIYMSMEVNIHEINIETPVLRIDSMRDSGGYSIVIKSFDELKQLPKNTWVKISTIRQVKEIHSLNRYSLQMGIMGEHPTNSGEQVARISFRKPIWINLTKMFGKGKEPTLSECDSIPYFEGMASVQAPTVKTCGKNLFYGEVVNNKNIDGNTGEVVVGNRTIPINFISVKPNITYTLTRPVSSGNVGIRYYSKNQNYLSTTSFVPANGKSTFTFTTPIGCYFLKFVDESNTLDNNYQIEEGSTATTYERYQSSSLTLPEEIVLRGLPNGVCDTYNTKTKEHTQRIGEIVLDGVNYKCIKIMTNGDETKRFDINFTFEKFVGANNWTNLTKMNASIICDKAICISNGHSVHPNKNAIASFNGILVLFIEDNTILTIEKANEWLQQNPITVQYELATPIVTEIDLPSLKAYNTVTHLSSTVGESSLVPTLASDHTVDYPVVIKPSTKYSIVAHKDCNYHTTNLNYTFDLGGATTTCSVNDTITTVTTPTTLSHQELRVKGQGLALSSVRVIEGEVTQDLPYFEGICDVKSPIVKNVGKNLFNFNDLELGSLNRDNGQPTTSNKIRRNKSFIDVSHVEKFTFSMPNYVKSDGARYVLIFCYDNNKNFLGFVGLGDNLATYLNRTLLSNTKLIKITIEQVDKNNPTDVFEVQFEEGSVATSYEPYKTNTTTFTSNDDEIIVLRSLPNGVCDTLNVRTGEYVQNIGETVLDGSDDESWSTNNTEGTTTNRFISPTLQNSNVDQTTGVGQFLCDKLKTETWSQTSRLGLTINGQDVFIYNASIDYTASAIKQWLSQNPVTVQYELATPIVKQVNVEGYPYAYESGHILLESGSQEQSLTPTIEYSLSANKTGQIDSNTRQVIRQQKKIDDFEALMLTQIVESYYDKAILQFDYEMQMLSLGGERNE